ncbi:serine/threonine-protein kinase [Streptomyces sp. NPDC051320]|uniref:serine/threonine-protein kinase n=1 Tax=Streptomyces sp. NPDC051320 TaxID=3154644 RepID=UPI003428BDA3
MGEPAETVGPVDALRPQDPTHIGAHAVVARLGAGGMGQVYLGRSPGGRLVAIKVIREEITDHPEALSRFRREVETVRAVRSAYTANLIDASLAAPPYWLATEYVTGPTLSRAVRERGPFPAVTCRGVFAALAEGLASVHAYGVTHRDLKPQNVILSAQGPQLIDFGIARGTGDAALTETGFAPGTPGFAAPEVLMANQVGPAADVFALGATMAYAATGRAPFGGGQPASVGYRVVHEEIDLAGVDPDLAALINWCVAKDPAARPSLTALIERCAVRAALVDDGFYGALAGLSDAVPVAGPVPVAVPEVGLHGAPTATAGQFAPGYTPTQGVAAPDHAPVAPSTRRFKPWMAAVAVVAAVGVGAVVAVQFMSGGGHADPAKDRSPSTSPSSGPPKKSAKAPSYIENNRVSIDQWGLSSDPGAAAHGIGQCRTFGGEADAPAEFQYSVENADDPSLPYVGARAKIEFRFKSAENSGTKPSAAPYYVSVGVRAPHDIDPSTGKPFPDLMMPNKSVGYTSRPVDAYANWKTGDFVTLTYPDDFADHTNGKVTDSIPVANDPGDWTVVFFHVKGTPTDYSSISCSGFRVK